MPTYVGLLRGINVGGNKKVAMSDLREHLTQAGFTEVRTLLQSGNVIFSSKTRPRIDQLFDSHFIVRTAAEWSLIVERNPFPREAKDDPAHLVVMALDDAPTPLALKALRDAVVGREVIKADGRQLYMFYPDGQGTSKLTNALIERKLGMRGTARNWNTVLKILNAL